MELETLIEILEASVKKNGEKPLTNLWLLNILKMCQTSAELDELEDDWKEMVNDIYWGN